jgi:hypothetical protein
MLRSKSNFPIKFEFSLGENVPNVISFSPKIGHLASRGTREVTVLFSPAVPTKLDLSSIICSLKRIEYKAENEDPSLHGIWDDSMKSFRKATTEDLNKISAAENALKEYNALVEAENKKGKKAKPLGPPPPKCLLELVPSADGLDPNVYEIIAEPPNQVAPNANEQFLTISCSGVADFAKYECEGDSGNIAFKPTFLFQSTVHKFMFKNESNLTLPVKWTFDDMKKRGNTRAINQSRLGSRVGNDTLPTSISCPFSIDPEEESVDAKSERQFCLKFLPLDAGDFVYLLRGDTLTAALPEQNLPLSINTTSEMSGSSVRMVLRGTGKRPICHFDIKETLDYMTRRPLNMKNENGLNSSIEATEIRVAELESTGLQTRNTFRFHVTNPTSDNYEFIWEAMGDPSPFWRCVQSSGMMFTGKRIEMVFEYLPEEVNVAEAFFKFRIPHLGLEQIFLFTGKVSEPKVFFSVSKIDYHSVMLGGEGSSETIYIENKEHLPFNFVFDRQSLLQLEGPLGPVLNISPKSG